MSSTKVAALTQNQLRAMARYRDKWIEIGSSNAPAHRPKAEAAIKKMYTHVGLSEPRIVWCGSPVAMVKAKMNCPLSEGGALVRHSVWLSVTRAARDAVWESISDEVWETVRNFIAAPVERSIKTAREEVIESLVSSAVTHLDKAWQWTSWYVQHDAHWLAMFDFFRNTLLLKQETEMIVPLLELAQHAGWYIPCETICWVSERPTIFQLDDQERLNSFSEPALRYPDGWGVYAVNGVRVPSFVIERPHDITLEHIEEESNAEVRRVMIERYGQGRFLLDSGARLIHTDPYGELYRKELSGDEPIVMVKVKNATREADGSFKTYFLRVPPHIRTAHAAVAWTFGYEAKDYSPGIET
jgi:hypothetical protein